MTARLAPELAAFRGVLDFFPEEHGQALGKMVQRVASLVGRLSATHLEGIEPDGFDGVEQKGAYHRLLISEWLLAEEAPEEFLRRAAMSEHLFLRLARKEARGGRRSLAFFDAGPLQLGSPRLLHLAILLALAHRAARGGAELKWAVLQNPSIAGTGATEGGIRQLLGARSSRLADADSAAAVLKHFEAPQRGDDIWWIGDERFLTSSRLPGSTVAVTDELLEAADSLHLDLSHEGHRRTVSLPLPEPSMRTRLMRDPFQCPTPSASPELLEAYFWPSSCGRYLFLANDEALHLVHLGGGAWQAFPRSIDGQSLVGIDRHRKRVACIFRRGTRYELDLSGDRVRLQFEQKAPAAPLGKAPLWQVHLGGRGGTKLIVRDAKGTVYVGQRAAEVFVLRPVLDRCTHLLWRRGYAEFVLRTPDLNLEFGNLGLDFRLALRGRGDSPRTAQLAVGFDPQGQTGMLAHLEPTSAQRLQSGEDRVGFATWRTHRTGELSALFRVRETLRVVGMKRHEGEWAPLVLSENRIELRLELQSRSLVITAFPEPVGRTAMVSSRPRLICELPGKLVVVDLPNRGAAVVRPISLPKLHGGENPQDPAAGANG